MTVLMLGFFAYLIYVSYCKIVFLMFRGKQHNRFFGAFLSTVIPVIGSVPAFIIAGKYERRVGGIAPKMNDYVLKCIIIVLQMISVFMLFFPLLEMGNISANGVDMISGLSVGGEEIFKPAFYLIYIMILPFVSAVVNAVDTKYNIRNVITYTFSLICALTVSLIALFADSDNLVEPTIALWLYCYINVTIMLLSFFSMVKVRNEYLLGLENEEEQEDAKNRRSDEATEHLAIPYAGSYKCSKCSKLVQKGTLCSCREAKVTLSTIMEKQNIKETSDFCVYCRRQLKPDEKCNCAGDGFGITIKPERYEGRKCRFCGQILVGDSTCVCEKIMKKSVPFADEPKNEESKSYFEHTLNKDGGNVSDELATLEQKIEQKFSLVKSTFIANKNLDLPMDDNN